MRNKEQEIKVIIAEPMKAPRVEVIKNELETLQGIVGGYIEIAHLDNDDNVCIIVNEEGKINRLPLNRGLYNRHGHLFDIVAGTMIIAGDDYESGEFISLTDEQEAQYMKQFKFPQTFIKMGEEIIGIPI